MYYDDNSDKIIVENQIVIQFFNFLLLNNLKNILIKIIIAILNKQEKIFAKRNSIIKFII